MKNPDGNKSFEISKNGGGEKATASVKFLPVVKKLCDSFEGEYIGGAGVIVGRNDGGTFTTVAANGGYPLLLTSAYALISVICSGEDIKEMNSREKSALASAYIALKSIVCGGFALGEGGKNDG